MKYSFRSFRCRCRTWTSKYRNNFVSGIILIFDKPIQIGDVVEISSESGRVKSMGLRTT
ncbi:mechanosensitive ion channel domain-containing protein, partial [Staphylococcus lugdunensis]|uniref:mechanosensitive ion channel domain-containing protein n=1 Tax=Staphylococcus lugdunensis TaxID=28035 RepID=UPI003BF61DA6